MDEQLHQPPNIGYQFNYSWKEEVGKTNWRAIC